MIRLLVNGWDKAQKRLLRDALLGAYKIAAEYSPGGYMCVTKALANALSWLEDDIAKM